MSLVFPSEIVLQLRLGRIVSRRLIRVIRRIFKYRQGQALPDTTLELFDIRAGKPLPSLEFDQGISFARLDPRDSNKVVVCSSYGGMDVLRIDGGEKESGDDAVQVRLLSMSKRPIVSRQVTELNLCDTFNSYKYRHSLQH